MKNKAIIAIVTALLPCLGQADLIAHYDFDTVTEADGLITSDEVTTNGNNFATAGVRADFTQSCRRLGTGSLLLQNQPGSDLAGSLDGALSNEIFDWGATGFNSDVRTIAFWMKASITQSDTTPTMISFRSPTGVANFQRFDVRLDAGRLRVELQGGGFTTASNLNDDTWHHVAVVVPLAESTLGDVKYYVDGQLIGKLTGTQAINTAPSQMRMGDSLHDIGRDFIGSLDDVRLYNEALDDAAVLALYDDGVANLPALLCFRPSNDTIELGEFTNLLWEVDPAVDSATIDRGIGDVLMIGAQGLVNVSPSFTTIYTLTVQRGGEQVQQEITIFVNNADLSLNLSAAGLNSSGGFVLNAANLVPGREYNLIRTTSLEDFDHLNGNADLLELFSPTEVTRQIIDPTPPAGKAFYRIQESGN